MYNEMVKAFFVLIWLSQFYSLIGLVVWLNRKSSDSASTLRKSRTAMRVQIIILAAIALFFIVDYLRNHLGGGVAGAPSFRFYFVNGAPYLIIPAIYLLVLAKIRKRLPK